MAIKFQEGMMELAWVEHMSAGNAIIDSEHKELVAMVNGAWHMIKNRDSFALSQAFDQIEHYFRVHFSDEEMIAQAVKFPFAENKLEDECVLKAIYLMRDVMACNNGVWDGNAEELFFELLSNGLTVHILKENMQMKPVLRNYPYDFKPARWHPELVQPEVNRRRIA